VSEWHLGERVLVSHKSRSVRGWLEQVNTTAVVVRLPHPDDPEKPGPDVATFACPPPPKWVTVITCTSVSDHHGIMIGYLDPTWARTEESALEFSRFLSFKPDPERIAHRAKVMRRERELSLAVSLAEARIYNDFGRAEMREQARRDCDASLANKT